MRGKETNFYKQDARNGIIPAHAGKRSTISNGMQKGKDHPRSCGEKCLIKAVI